MSFEVYDRATGRRYINVVYATREQAASELLGLLRPYPAGHEWRKRLAIRMSDEEPTDFEEVARRSSEYDRSVNARSHENWKQRRTP